MIQDTLLPVLHHNSNNLHLTIKEAVVVIPIIQITNLETLTLPTILAHLILIQIIHQDLSILKIAVLVHLINHTQRLLESHHIINHIIDHLPRRVAAHLEVTEYHHK